MEEAALEASVLQYIWRYYGTFKFSLSTAPKDLYTSHTTLSWDSIAIGLSERVLKLN
jgi:hypothetical protein